MKTLRFKNATKRLLNVSFKPSLLAWMTSDSSFSTDKNFFGNPYKNLEYSLTSSNSISVITNDQNLAGIPVANKQVSKYQGLFSEERLKILANL